MSMCEEVLLCLILVSFRVYVVYAPWVFSNSCNSQEFGACPSVDVPSDACEKAGAALLQSFREMYESRTKIGAAGGKNKGKFNSGISIPTPYLKEVGVCRTSHALFVL
jgi:hypothetical protein